MPESQHKQPTIIVRAEILLEQSLLVVKRSAGKTRPEEWELPGGKIDAGETLEEALMRELREEVNCSVLHAQYRGSFNSLQDHALIIVFSVTIDSADDIKLSEEHSEFAWISKDTVSDYELTSDFKTYIQNRLNTKFNDDNKSTKESKTLHIYTDGGSRGNPGPSATGYVVYDDNGTLIDSGGSYLGVTTNNQAEYQALLEAAKKSHEFSPEKIIFSLDSQLVVNQMTGKYKIKNKDLWPVHEAIVETLRGIDVNYTYVPREKNKEADAMVNQVLDARK
ncbi:TPA: NUDIX domain-containing protein [Candidatus Saccharibacteria bacterium]|nr:NUDIX domain-containing protein [Candidatus Saccharibacteria bacterium]HIO87688.1 NUDIX domain-containing protein [Candidatus Saccharibacteria bacterium]